MSAPEKWTEVKHRLVACMFSFICGYVDVVSVTRWKCFATMMTGNVVFIGRALIGQEISKAMAKYYLAVIFAFFIGVVSYSYAEHRWPDRGASRAAAPILAIWLVMEAVLFYETSIQDISSMKRYRWTPFFFAPAFGVLSGASAGGRLATPTNLVTGHLVTISNAVVKACTKQKWGHAFKIKTLMSCSVLASTFAGALTGAGVLKYMLADGTHGALLPIGPLLMICFWLNDNLAKPRSLLKKMKKLRKQLKGSSEARASATSTDAHGVGLAVEHQVYIDGSIDLTEDSSESEEEEEEEDQEQHWEHEQDGPRLAAV